MPQEAVSGSGSRPFPRMTKTHYEVLGVSEEAGPEDLKAAYRQQALRRHPDKGGEDEQFHEVKRAYNVLEDAAQREAYDAELQRERDRAELVEGAPPIASQSGLSPGAARVKTAPTPGSTRSKKVLASGNSEWAQLSSGAGIMKALTDDITPEAKTDLLFHKYAALPPGKEKKREWLKGIRGQEKADLKARAKAHEKSQVAKWDRWLGVA